MESQGNAGSAALALALVAKEVAGTTEPSSMSARLVDLQGGSLGILFEGNPAAVVAALASAETAAQRPAFMSPDYPESEWQDALRTLRLAALDGPDRRGLGRGWRLGTIQGLFAADLSSAREAWRSGFSPDRLRGILVADASILSPIRQFALARATERPLPRGARPVLSGQGARILLAEYLAEGRDYAQSPPWYLAAEGAVIDEPLPRPVAASLGPAPADAALADPTAKAVTAMRLQVARGRALSRLFDDDGAAKTTIAMGLDWAAGGDGTLPFALAESIESSDQASVAVTAASLGVAFP